MSHEVETMAFAHETPWHGLGRRVDPTLTPAEMCSAAGLGWSVDKHPMTVCVDGETQTVPGKRALVRSTDRSILGVVGEHWHPLQNEDALDFFTRFTREGGATMETAGALRGGRMVWGLANLNCGFILDGGDVVKGYLLLASPHEAGRSIMAKVTTVRVVCANTLALARQDQTKFEARFTHRTAFDKDAAVAAMGLARESVSEFEKNARLLQKLNITRDDAVRILAPIYQQQDEVEALVQDDAKWSATLGGIMLATVKGAGAVPGSAWGLLSGVTFWSDHVANRNPDARLASSWTGTEAARKEKVLSKLLEMAQ